MRMVKVFGLMICLNLSGCGYDFVKKSEQKSEEKEPSIIGLWKYECEKSERSMVFGDSYEFETLYEILTLDFNDKKIKGETIYYKDRKCKEKVVVSEIEWSIKISKEDQNNYLTDLEAEYASETIYDKMLLNNFNTRNLGFDAMYKVQAPHKIGVPKEFNLSGAKPFYSKVVIKDGKFCQAEPKGSKDGLSESRRATEIDEDNCATRI